MCIMLKKCAFLLLVVVSSFLSSCVSHSHEHRSFKYSREANENFDRNTYERNDHDHDHDIHDHSHDGHNLRLDNTKIWVYSMSSTLFISAVPFLLLFVIPLDNSDEMRPRLKVLLAFASGGLLGDAFLHLIPHASSSHYSHSHESSHSKSHSHSHDHSKDTAIGVWVLGGIITFLTVEKLVRLLKAEDNSSYGHSHGPTKKGTHVVKTNKNSNNDKTNKKAKKHIKENAEVIEVSGYLNLAADFTHNFTDGLAIGASFIAGNSIGIVTTITILLHEVPHEIGDFAILIKSGCSRRKAMLFQLLTAIGALSGNALALVGVGSDVDAIPWVLPFTAGGFIYIATVSVLPELLEESTKLGQSIKEICSLLAGILVMVFISHFE